MLGDLVSDFWFGVSREVGQKESLVELQLRSIQSAGCGSNWHLAFISSPGVSPIFSARSCGTSPIFLFASKQVDGLQMKGSADGPADSFFTQPAMKNLICLS